MEAQLFIFTHASKCISLHSLEKTTAIMCCFQLSAPLKPLELSQHYRVEGFEGAPIIGPLSFQETLVARTGNVSFLVWTSASECTHKEIFSKYY